MTAWRGRHHPAWLGVVVGVVLGFWLGSWSRHVIAPCLAPPRGGGETGTREAPETPDYNAAAAGGFARAASRYEEPPPDGRGTNQPQTAPAGGGQNASEQSPRKLLLIGVMTAKKYLNTRIVASYQTWAKTVPGDILYFSSEGSENVAIPGLPVIGLKGVDDSYPPQKKSFLMLKYMHDYAVSRYEWFMRADDDLYVKGADLGHWLRGVNSSQKHFIGQAGQGNKEEKGLLSLARDENFCMGGPGMLLSAPALAATAPHISYCLKNLYTTHEDVEIGRCVARFAGVSCTWAFEMQSLFYHNHNEPNGSFTQQLRTKDVHRALTLHPFKNHTYQYRMHTYQHQRHSATLRHRRLLLHRQVNAVNEILQDRDAFYSPSPLGLPPSLLKHAPASRGDVLDWDFLASALFSHRTQNPRPGLTNPLKAAFDDIMLQVMSMINKNARQRGRTIDFNEILYGYRRVDPTHGADYILDLLLVYRKHKGRKMTIPVRRHAYLQQAFSGVEFREDEATDTTDRGAAVQPPARTRPAAFLSTPGAGSLLQLLSGRLGGFLGTPPGGHQQPAAAAPRDDKTLHLLVPLRGRLSTLRRFTTALEAACLSTEPRVALRVMLYSSDDSSSDAATVTHIAALQAKYPHHDLRVARMDGGQFSRGRALEAGAALFPGDSLLVFLDVDMDLQPAAVQRIKWNTQQSRQVYFPIVFSQYDPATSPPGGGAAYRDAAGYWRAFGFGIAAMYGSDFTAVGGFDKSLVGWGLEDVRLYERFVASSNLSVLRAPDPGLVHVFHPIHCDPTLGSDQYSACLGTKAANFGSAASLSRSVRARPDLYTGHRPPAPGSEVEDPAADPNT